MSDEELRHWDVWFGLVGGEYLEQWEAVKLVILRAEWSDWAVMIEMNCIGDVTAAKSVADGATA